MILTEDGLLELIRDMDGNSKDDKGFDVYYLLTDITTYDRCTEESDYLRLADMIMAEYGTKTEEDEEGGCLCWN